MTIDIQLGDCLDISKTLESKSIDLIISDYPFNCQDSRKNYEEFIYQTSLEYLRLAKDVCNLVVINSPAKIFTTSRYFQDWTLINEIALIRKGSLRPAWHLGFQHNTCLILNRGGIKNKWNGTKVNHDKTFPTDVMEYQNGFRGKGGMWHPQAIPLDFTRNLISWLSDEGDTVLDFFTGSGTTAVVCKELNRNFIGTEINETYYEMTLSRIK